MLVFSLLFVVLGLAACTHPEVNRQSEPVREHAEAAFQRLQAETVKRVSEDLRPEYDQTTYMIGIGM